MDMVIGGSDGHNMIFKIDAYIDYFQPVGPFKEGDPLTIMCVATGGEPPPSVLWYKENQIIDRTYIANEKGAVQNTLTIQR